jgi:amino acid adenylation domain-containing protein
MAERMTLSSFTPEQRLLLRQQMRARRIPVLQIPIERQPREGGSYPLSYSQERLWLTDQLEAETSSYHLYQGLRITGPVHEPLLEQSLILLAERHESLRTAFGLEAGTPMQIILPEPAVTLRHVELAGDSEEERLRAFEEAAEALLSEPFDLSQPPLLRTALYDLDADDHILLFVIHHIICDGWSLRLITEELIQIYNALLKGKAPALEVLPRDYADYACWQREWFQDDLLEDEIGYWKQKLEGANPFYTFPSGRSRPPVQTFRGSRQGILLEQTQLEALKKLSRTHGVSLFMTLLAAYKVLLYRYTGDGDVVIGTPTAGRSRGEMERMIGCFVNNLVLRTQITGTSSFAEVLKETSRTVLEAMGHQNVPFEKIIQTVNPERNLSYSPLFQLFFIFQQGGSALGELNGAVCTPLDYTHGTSKFDLTLEAIEYDDYLDITLEYSTNLYEKETAEALLSHYSRLLYDLSRHADTPVSSIDFLTPAEKSRLLGGHNTGTVEYPRHVTLDQLVEQQRQASPDATALVCEEGTFTYAALMEQAERLAAYLQTSAVVGPSRTIGICAAPSLGLAAGILGILKAGCAYVPLDPAFPEKRLQYIADHAELDCILVQDSADLAKFSGQRCLDIGAAARCWHDDEAVFAEPETDRSELAYMIYTSGSTGTPKGVRITHRNVAHFLFSMQQLLQLGTEDTLLSVTTCSFDIFVLELFLPLITGASVIFPAKGTAGDAQLLRKALERHSPTFMQATPVLWRMLLAEGWEGPDTMTLLCGGEELKSDLAAALQQRGRAVWNLYGPTETTVWSLAHRLEQVDIHRFVPIGRPIGGTTCFILDGELNPVPPGAEGNLYIGGDGVSPGYHRQRGLTAERFIISPFDPEGLEMLFDTGDRARLLPDGTFVYAGRRDQQIKVRGFRIEPSEIERRLNDQPGVVTSAVVAAEDGSGERSLVAYWVPSSAAAEDTETEWRALLREELPSYMIPSHFIRLRELPLTPNKKVDRKHLSLLPLDKVVSDRAYTAPRSELERKLVLNWERILNRRPIGIHDHFFDLGGHSLLAVQLLAVLNGEFGTGLALRQLFLAPTIAQLGSVIEGEAGETGTATDTSVSLSLPPFVSAPAHAHAPFPLTEVQMAYWMGRQADLAIRNVSTHVYQEMEIANLDLLRFQQSLNFLIRRHPMLRGYITQDGMQQVLPEVPDYVIEVIDVRDATAHNCRIALDGVRKGMSHQVHSGGWPLFAVQATRLPEDRTRLHISFDLMIADARSFQIILSELAGLYARSRDLPVLEATFRDYVLSLESLTGAEVYDASKAYWLERVPTLPPGPELPLRPASLKLEKPEFKRWKAVLDSGLWSRLAGKAREQGITKSVLLLSCFSEVLAQYSKQPHFLLNLTLFNRLPLHPQLDEVVGDFTTVSLLEVDFSQRRTFGARALAVQDRLWNDLDHRYYSGIRVTEQLLKRGLLNEPVPVVFTSLLDMPQGDEASFEDIFRLLNEEETEARSISQTPQVWLDHQVAERGGELHFNWDVVEDLFPAEMVEDMFAAYCGLLHQLGEGQNLWEQDLPLSGPEAAALPHRMKLSVAAEKHADTLGTDGAALHQGFQLMARMQPDEPAVIAPQRSLSYAELNQEANVVAQRLLSLPGGPGQLVAVVMDKGWEQVAAVLGILKAKAAYLPIDAALPGGRIHELLRLGQVKAAVVQQAVSLEGWPEGITAFVAGASESTDSIPDYGWDDGSYAGQLAYVIFTSGSTGTPKGVMIDHQSAVNTIADINGRFGVHSADTVFGLSALSFDLSVYDIFGTLAAGGTLVLPQPDRLRDPSHWLELVKAHHVTIWNSVPALMNMLTAYADHGQEAASLRLALLSGDWIPLGLPGDIRRLNSEIEVVSLGGATEASIWSIMYPIEAVDPDWKSIPYGLSLSNQRVYVLSRRMEECPPGVPGELYIGGSGVALGYWMDEPRTAEQFVLHPVTGERLYRTGDTGLYREDGSIEFLGRGDFQVKVGGYRIELGEIESVIQKHPAVREAVVLTDGEGDGKRLHAFVALDAEQALAPGGPDIRSYLRDRLPGYMIPGSIALLEEIPLTGNGKVNRAALLAEHIVEQAPAMPPQSGLEAELTALWSRLLNRQQMSTDDHFFDIGGNSLKLIQMQKELQKLLGREVPIVDLFKYTTIASLASHLGGSRMEAEPVGTGVPTRGELRLSSRRTRRR